MSAFISADIPRILELNPDLVLTFSDIQADIVAALVRAGIPVHAFNQRTIAEILAMVRTIGALVGAQSRADALARDLAANVEHVRRRNAENICKPRVYFEEWDDPMISAIAWVSELISVAGGVDIFSERSSSKGAHGRIVTGQEVIGQGSGHHRRFVVRQEIQQG